MKGKNGHGDHARKSNDRESEAAAGKGGGKRGKAASGANAAALSEEEASAFRERILAYYRAHGRSLPWRETRDPYAILVSEIMLQQTQVDRVREKYRAFLAVFPGFEELARAPLADVLSLWQGLGYNRRAISLKLCAEAVVERCGGRLPGGIPELEALPGIGPYTARAVALFAFGEPTPFIETNIRSVYLHHFFPGEEKVSDALILPLVEATMDREDPREWYYALMDYGSQLKRTGENPSRRSAHHTRQSPFRGSNREQRSLILKAILANPGITGQELRGAVPEAAASLEKNLLQLEREGFICREEDGYRVR
ncbi:A/G-specific adenine glycosylase [Geomonas sp. Red32]|uniref:A/G-specific adenine glycosylase n=1 Tax=Geomonas sp. Red32 TaxID=2912856 RepID=UPI00202CDE09|nr:A/G-specific adenine glycosylase [Geomonas sp. Red32]